MNSFLKEAILIKIGKKSVKNDTLRSTVAGGIAGVVGTAVTQPLDNVVVQMQNELKGVAEARAKGLKAPIKTVNSAKDFLRQVKLQTLARDTWTKVTPIRALKAGISTATIFGAYAGLNQLMKKQSSVYSDFGVKPGTTKKTEPTTSRWTPLDAESRLTWSKLTGHQKKQVNQTFTDMPDRLRDHNKTYFVKELKKGRKFDKLLERITQKLQKQPKAAL